MKTNKLILLGLICLTVAMPTTAQNRNEKKARTERAVKEAIAAKQYKINVDRMQPMRGGSRNLTTNYTLEIRNDSVFSYLPYFGVAYNAPYGGGKSLNFNASITGYTTRALKKGKIQIDFKTPDYYEFDEKNYCLMGRRKHRIYRLGDPIRIKVARANLERKQLDFALVE